jgi:DNA topoisomerase VI subunit A
MIRNGFTPRENWGKTREYITGEIDKVCQELFENVEREDLGIVAKARGMMLYDGHTYPVDMDSFEALGRNGVFILVIEKEGIASILQNAAKDSGVALVHTAGRFTKYVKYLIEHAQVPVATLTDYETIFMAYKVI